MRMGEQIPIGLVCTEWYKISVCYVSRVKRHCMGEPGSDGNLNVMFFKNSQINMLRLH